MRSWTLIPVAAVALSFAGCSREDANRSERDFGKAAYKTKEASEKAAARAAHELHQAGREAHEGWNEAKHERKDTRRELPPPK
jgi:hypothetical protein